MVGKRFRRTAAIGVFAASGALPAVSADAHNAGHITRPDGTCQDVGSGRPAPLVGPDKERLDLMPETPNPPFDEYGTSFAAFQGDTPIQPGSCSQQ